MRAVLSGVAVAHDVGFMAYGSLYDARLLVLASDAIARSRYAMQHVDLTGESMALDVIDDIARGRGGETSFLARVRPLHFLPCRCTSTSAR